MVKNRNTVRVPIEGEAEGLRAKLSSFRADVLSGRLDLFDVFDQDPQRAYTSLQNFLCINDGRALELYGRLLITVGFLSEGKGQKGQNVKSEGPQGLRNSWSSNTMPKLASMKET